MSEENRRQVAIACQGGGSHAAFTAGALDRLLSEGDVDYRVTALTGTSGGAICAFLAWYGLASEPDEERGRATARTLLEKVWDEIAARDPASAAANRAAVWWAQARDNGAPLPTTSPYATPINLAQGRLRRILERAVPPEDLAAVVEDQCRTSSGPRLLVGAVDVQRGTFRTFTEREITHDALLASAAVPTLFEAVELDEGGERRYYWDGLFSQNPPIRNLLSGVDAEEKPEELWLLRINPQRRERIPRSLGAIDNRRNELAGNLSVNQELATVRAVNEWVADGSLSGDYRAIAVKTVDLDESKLSPPRSLVTASKLDTDPTFLAELRAHGASQAESFLDTETTRRLVRGTVEAAWNAESPVASAYVDEGFRLHTAGGMAVVRGAGDEDSSGRGAPGAERRGWEAYAAYIRGFREALEGLTVDVDTVVASGDRAAHRWTAIGTHVGRLFGVEPTGERVTVEGVQFLRVADDRLVEAWVDVDEYGFRRRVGVVDTNVDVPVAATRGTPITSEVADTAETRRLVREHVELGWSGGRDPASFVAPGHVFHMGDADLKGPSEYAAVVERYRRAFPDLSVTVRDLVAEGDRVVVRAAMTGTHEGPFHGVAPTGRRVEARWTFLVGVENGAVTETGLLDDRRWLLDQLDVRPIDVERGSDTSTHTSE